MNSLSNRSAFDRGTLLALLLVALNLRPALASLGPVLESVRSDLQLSYGVVGLLTSLPVICMGLFAPAAMPLSARFGLKHTILSMLVLIGLATLLRKQANLPCLLISSLLVGAAIALLGPLLSAYVKQSFPKRSARISSWVTTALCLGAALSAGSSAALSHWLGWPCALSSWALLAFVAAWLWQHKIPNSLNDQTLAIQALPWRQLRAWQLMFTFGLHSLVFYGLLTWLAPAYISYGLSAASAGGLLGLFALVQIVGTLLVGALPIQQRERRPALILASVCTLSGLLAVWWWPLAAPHLWVSLLGAGTAALFALTLILPLDYSDSPDGAGSWTAMMSGGGYIIAACGPYLCGLLRDMTGSYASVFAALSIACTMALLLCTLLRPSKAHHGSS